MSVNHPSLPLPSAPELGGGWAGGAGSSVLPAEGAISAFEPVTSLSAKVLAQNGSGGCWCEGVLSGHLMQPQSCGLRRNTELQKRE